MKAVALDAGDDRRWLWIVFGVLVSLGGHVAVAYAVSKIPVSTHGPSAWIEMAVAVSEPPKPPPPPPPPPEEKKPEPPKPKDPVKFEKPPKDAPPPPVEAQPTPKPPRLVKGLTATSFAPGSNTGLQVAAGTTTATKTEAKMSLEDANAAVLVPYTKVTKAPKIRSGQSMIVPDDVIAAKIVGRVEVELTIDVEGNVTNVDVVQPLHPLADAACVAHCKKTKWTPYEQDGAPASVMGVPFSCRFEQID